MRGHREQRRYRHLIRCFHYPQRDDVVYLMAYFAAGNPRPCRRQKNKVNRAWRRAEQRAHELRMGYVPGGES